MSKLAHTSTKFINYETDRKHITFPYEDPEDTAIWNHQIFIAHLYDYRKPAYQTSLMIIILANQALLPITSITLDSRRNEQQ